jgi:DNA-binding MarR family transcriptional regulator
MAQKAKRMPAADGGGAASNGPNQLPKDLIRHLLDFYYPMHYRIGMDLETLMCQGRISRMQAAILWLIHSRAEADGWMRRKEIERRLSAWFEISNSNISKLLRELAKPPLSLVTQEESPASGREKVIRLTAAGRKFVDGMIEAAIAFLAEQLARNVNEEELRWGVDFFALAFRTTTRADGVNESSQPLPRPPGRIEGAHARSARARSIGATARNTKS